MLTPPEDLAALRAVSADLGADPLLIQGAGGNTSVKDGGTMWIKASGTLLAEAQARDIFVPVDLGAMRAALAAGDPVADQPGAFLLQPGGLRPSIETSLHAVFPRRVVLHVHCVETIALAIRADAAAALAPRLAGLAWAVVPYAKPGATLAALVSRAVAQGADIVVLGNHGLIVAGDSVEAARALLADVVARLRAAPGPDAPPTRPSAQPGFRPALAPEAHWIAHHPHAIAWAEAGSLYPDHVIFCGAGAMVLRAGQTARGVAAGRAATGAPPCHLAIVPGEGVLLSEAVSAGAEALARCLSDVLRRVPLGAPLVWLTAAETAALLDWDAEKYRQALDAR